MRGLIWKDLLVMRKTIRAYALFLGIYLLMAILGMFDVSIVTATLNVMVMILPMSAFSYDELAKWARYAATLPLGTRRVVGARYIFTLLMALVAALFGLLACAVLAATGGGSVPELLATVLTSLGFGLFIADILLPLCYKLGPERARPWMYVVILLPIVLLFLAYKMGVSANLTFLNRLPDSVVLSLFALVPLAALAGLVISFLISCRIMERKEL